MTTCISLKRTGSNCTHRAPQPVIPMATKAMIPIIILHITSAALLYKVQRLGAQLFKKEGAILKQITTNII